MGEGRLVRALDAFPVQYDDRPLPGVWARYGETIGRLAVDPNPTGRARRDWLLFDPASAGPRFPFWIFSGPSSSIPRRPGLVVAAAIVVPAGLEAGQEIPGFAVRALADALPGPDEVDAWAAARAES